MSFDRDDNWESLCCSLSFRTSIEISSNGFTQLGKANTQMGTISGLFAKNDQQTVLTIEAPIVKLELREDSKANSISGTLFSYGMKGQLECQR